MENRKPIALPGPQPRDARATRTIHVPTFGEMLRRYRMAAALTQQELAERATISARAIGYLEQGVTRPQSETVRLLAVALALPAEEHAAFEEAARVRRIASPAPLTSVTLPDTNVRAPLTPLIGREDAVAGVIDLLRQETVRLVTITGPGGVGKTRLALAVASVARADFPDGVFFVPLASLRDAALVLPSIAQTMGVRERPGDSPHVTLANALRHKRLLLVLDNFEQIVPAASAIAHLLTHCPSLRILVTSRAVLRIPGERGFPLAPLAVPPIHRQYALDTLADTPAVTLFLDRARAISPDFMLTAANAGAVADICIRLEGLPLALELAAARVRMLGPRDLATRLETRLSLLTRGPHDRPARHQTMWDAIAWSDGLLAAEEQRLFRRLAVFVGGWTVDAAEIVCTSDDLAARDVLDLMDALLDQSLVHAEHASEDAARGEMYETIREYAHQRLIASGEYAQMARQHAAYYVGIAEAALTQVGGSEAQASFTRLEREHDNLRAALRWARDTGEIETGLRIAGALWHFWYTRGYMSEGSGWLESLLALTGPSTPASRARALQGAAWLAWGRADFAAALERSNASASLWRAIGDKRGLADALTLIGAARTDMGEYAEAVALQEEALALRREIEDRRGIAQSLNNLANVLRHRGERERSLRLYEEGLAIRRQDGDRMMSATILLNIGQLLQELGEYERADRALTESLELHGNFGGKVHIGNVFNSLGSGARARGEHRQAQEQYDRCLALFQEVDSKADIARTLINLAHLAHDTGDSLHAEMLAEESLALSQATHHARNTAYTLICLGDIIRARGDLETARARYVESLQSFRAAGNPLGTMQAIERLGLLATDAACSDAAARLLGFSAATRAMMRTPAPPVERDPLLRAEAMLRDTLGAEAFHVAWETGSAMTLDAAVAEALALSRLPTLACVAKGA